MIHISWLQRSLLLGDVVLDFGSIFASRYNKLRGKRQEVDFLGGDGIPEAGFPKNPFASGAHGVRGKKTRTLRSNG